MIPHNFGGLEKKYSEYNNAKIVILPVPYDGTSTYGKGADKGPDAIITSSGYVELYDIETQTEVFKQGIFTAKNLKVTNKTKPEIVVQKIQEQIKKYLDDNKFVVMLGGEHSISTGMAQAVHEKYKNMSVLHLDAHGDTRDTYNNSKYNHACVMARIREFAPVVQVGIRSIDVEEVQTKQQNQKIFFAHEICGNNNSNNTAWMQQAVDALSPDVFISIDLDVFDPAYMPSTGTPEPGGLDWYTVLNFLQKVIAQKNVVGIDVVELAPNKNNPAPDFLAAKLIYRLLSMKFAKK
ncbi:MAG: agmatinase [Candidatus Woesearchaeota archaeon]|jgi:agmatinase